VVAVNGAHPYTAITQVAYDQTRRRGLGPGCAGGHHHARGTTDRDGAVAWVCVRCPAVRDGGDPTWRTP
jgi:hypothetical protein